ncbi:MAG: dihydroorotate dehydrogenase electron transfer subunit [Bacteroidales bacterium]|nr:dihydroorotate dehydrogenase electron transfer subunit [Bacteroidales bacterium]
MPKKYIQDFEVLDNKVLNFEYFTLLLRPMVHLPEILPGQFVEALIDTSQKVFLRRPFSVHDVDYTENTLTLLIQVVGEGTHNLQKLVKGEVLNLIFPLGTPYSLPENKKVLLVGGGCGIAPLLYLARYLHLKGMEITTLMGGRSAEYIIEVDKYKAFGEVLITTDDGSMGEKGFVTQHSIFNEKVREYGRIYTCGPEPMMKSIASIAKEKGIDCEVSLENLMACGIGACLCCVVETTTGNRCTCTEGPVFNIKDLKW